MSSFNKVFASLPVVQAADGLLQQLLTAAVLIFVSPPGSGKTVGLPPLINTRLRRRVYVAVPRRVAAVGAAKFAAGVYGQEVGETVGFQIGGERDAGRDTEVLYMTYGILIRKLLGGWIPDGVVVLDEIHEWSIEQDLALGLIRRLREQNPEVQAVVMSATLNADPLSLFFNGAPVVELPGNLFPIADRPQGGLSPEAWAVKLATEEERSVIVFQPGKKEIADSIREIQRLLGTNNKVRVFELQGEMELSKQREAIDFEGRKIVVATNIAEASVTVNGVSAVVDTGMERRSFEVGGAHSLRLVPTSRAQREQRRGRSGRQMPGGFVDCCATPLEDRPEYPTPEIFRKGIEEVILQVREMEMDLRSLPLVHQPKTEDLDAAEKLLKVLGLIGNDGEITEAGRFASRLACDVRVARTLWAARERGILDEAIVAAAILEEDGILDRNTSLGFVTRETESDLLQQVEIFWAAKSMKFNTRKEKGIHGKAYARVEERIRDLCEDLGVSVTQLHMNDREEMVEAIASGFCDEVYFHTQRDNYAAQHGERRFLGRESILAGKCYPIVVGKQRDAGGRAQLLTLATPVTPEQLLAAVPHLCTLGEPQNVRLEEGKLVGEVTFSFQSRELRRTTVSLENHPLASRLRGELDERLNQEMINQALQCEWKIVEMAAEVILPEPRSIEAGNCRHSGKMLVVWEALGVYNRGSDYNTPSFQLRRYRTEQESREAYGQVLVELTKHRERLERKAREEAERLALEAKEFAEQQERERLAQEALDAKLRAEAAHKAQFTTEGGLDLSGLSKLGQVIIKKKKK